MYPSSPVVPYGVVLMSHVRMIAYNEYCRYFHFTRANCDISLHMNVSIWSMTKSRSDTHSHSILISHYNPSQSVNLMAKCFFSPPKDELSSCTLSFALLAIVICGHRGQRVSQSLGGRSCKPKATAHQHCTQIYNWVDTPRCHIWLIIYSFPPPNVHFVVYHYCIIFNKSDVWAMYSL